MARGAVGRRLGRHPRRGGLGLGNRLDLVGFRGRLQAHALGLPLGGVDGALALALRRLVDQFLAVALRFQDFRAAQPLRVRLLLHGLARAAVDVDVGDLVAEHADAPGLRRLVQGLRDADVELLALEEELVQFQIPDFFAHRGLGQRSYRPFRVLDAVTRLVRVDDARVDGAVEVDVDVVLRDGRLGMNIDGRLFERSLVRDLVDDREWRSSGPATPAGSARVG